MKVKIKGDLQTRASFKPNSFDSETRTVDVVWSTGARVKRFSWGGDYHEELSMSPAHIRMDRLKNGAPVLDSHSNGGLRNIIGVVEKASLKDGEGLATIRLSDRPEVAGIVRDIENGIIRNLSVGYKVHKYKKVKEEKRSEDGEEDETPIYRAVDWEPLEISFVGIPADHKSTVRNEEQSYEVEVDSVNNNEGDSMKKKANAAKTRSEEEVKASEVVPSTETSEEKAGDASSSESSEDSEDDDKGGPVTEEPPVKEESEEKKISEGEVRALEIKRGKEIRSAVRIAKLGEDFADKLIEDAKMSVDQARAEIFKAMESKQPETRNNNIEVRDMDNKELRRQATVRGILHRFDPSSFKMKEGENNYVKGNLLDNARNYLAGEGVSEAFRMSPSEVATRAMHTTSDFPLILADVANKTLRQGYEAVPSTYAPFVRERSVSNFKDINSYQLSRGGLLRKVNEHGEYERGSLVESAEKYKVEKYGLIIGKTWELIVNDDMDALTSVTRDLGVRAKEGENKAFWDLILSNPIMADGFALFSAQHGNLGTAAAISIASVNAARTSMRLLKDLDGELISMNPKYLVTPATLEMYAQQFLAPINPTESADFNPFARSLTPMSEPRLDAASLTAWYLFADKNSAPMVELARLDGKGPEVFTRDGFDIDGTEVKIRYVFGMHAVDYRGFYKNPGV